jgi:5-methyltetrahydrofolate--homocysteine methyltransferase
MAHILDVPEERMLLCDGGMGSRVRALDLDIERDYIGQGVNRAEYQAAIGVQ